MTSLLKSCDDDIIDDGFVMWKGAKMMGKIAYISTSVRWKGGVHEFDDRLWWNPHDDLLHIIRPITTLFGIDVDDVDTMSVISDLTASHSFERFGLEQHECNAILHSANFSILPSTSAHSEDLVVKQVSTR
ncbi:unnamed protein product, partial [Mesorhabditis belari]|uniref:Uncharacterized protein n=1 Tax=Mesorhabditis belari TaxID=2138241 RepID=A0AAF3F4A4_9BILA